MMIPHEIHLELKEGQDTTSDVNSQNKPSKHNEFYYQNLCEKKDQEINVLSISNNEKERLIQYLKKQLKDSRIVLEENRKKIQELAPRKTSSTTYTNVSHPENHFQFNNSEVLSPSSSPQASQTVVSKTGTLPRFQELLKIVEDPKQNEFHYKHLVEEKDQTINTLLHSNNEKEQTIKYLETQIQYVRTAVQELDKKIKDLTSPKKPKYKKTYTEIPHSESHYQFNNHREFQRPSFEAPLIQLPQTDYSETRSLPNFQEFLKKSNDPNHLKLKLEKDRKELRRLANSLSFNQDPLLRDYADDIKKFSNSPNFNKAQNLIRTTRNLIRESSFASIRETLSNINPLLQVLVSQPPEINYSPNDNVSAAQSIGTHQTPPSKKAKQEAPSNVAPFVTTFKPVTQTSPDNLPQVSRGQDSSFSFIND